MVEFKLLVQFPADHILYQVVSSLIFFLRYYYYYYYCEIFAPAVIGGLSLESGWEQISSGLQDSPEYSSRTLQCCGLDDLDSSSDFQFLQSPFLTVKNRYKHTVTAHTLPMSECWPRMSIELKKDREVIQKETRTVCDEKKIFLSFGYGTRVFFFRSAATTSGAPT